MDIKCVFYENIYVFISLDSIVGYIGIYLNLLMYIILSRPIYGGLLLTFKYDIGLTHRTLYLGARQYIHE